MSHIPPITALTALAILPICVAKRSFATLFVAELNSETMTSVSTDVLLCHWTAIVFTIASDVTVLKMLLISASYM